MTCHIAFDCARVDAVWYVYLVLGHPGFPSDNTRGKSGWSKPPQGYQPTPTQSNSSMAAQNLHITVSVGPCSLLPSFGLYSDVIFCGLINIHSELIMAVGKKYLTTQTHSLDISALQAMGARKRLLYLDESMLSVRNNDYQIKTTYQVIDTVWLWQPCEYYRDLGNGL